ncbi:MAG: hypothetical protein VKL41_20085 [Snowella sp.]|nr:hypothetical protein [Snowella sp.]
MSSILEIYKQNKQLILDKSIRQVLSFAGDGKLRNNNETCQEFRELLSVIPTEYLVKYANECLDNKFDDSGLVLQDIINQAGKRLDFKIEYGLYQGSKNTIGYDGIWDINQENSIIVEVKTTDAYRINLDHIYNYKRKLVEQKRISETSSILIIVGRKDTGDLEAQIRGSRYGWDFRLISVDSLMKLVQLKEKLDDEKTIKQISEILRPLEFTRLDKLIEIVFETTQDIQSETIDYPEIDSEFEENDKQEHQINEENQKKIEKTSATSRVNFYEKCLQKIELSLNINLVKKSRIGYQTPDQQKGFVFCISKVYLEKLGTKYWFVFHPKQENFLNYFKESYVVYSCGSEDNTFSVPLKIIQNEKDNLCTTEKEGKIYWHIHIHERNNNFYLRIPKTNQTVDIEKYRV